MLHVLPGSREQLGLSSVQLLEPLEVFPFRTSAVEFHELDEVLVLLPDLGELSGLDADGVDQRFALDLGLFVFHSIAVVGLPLV